MTRYEEAFKQKIIEFNQTEQYNGILKWIEKVVAEPIFSRYCLNKQIQVRTLTITKIRCDTTILHKIE